MLSRTLKISVYQAQNGAQIPDSAANPVFLLRSALNFFHLLHITTNELNGRQITFFRICVKYLRIFNMYDLKNVQNYDT
jgi:hypothetical protein